jgi:hypothetical protein
VRTGQKTSAGNGWALDAAGAQSTDTNGHFERRSNGILPFRFWPSLCENANPIDRDRTSYSFMIAISARTGSPFKFEIERKKIILVALGVFEFSHSLDPQET